MRADESFGGRIDVESYSWWYQLLFSGQIAFATQTSSVKYEVSDLWGDEKKNHYITAAGR